MPRSGSKKSGYLNIPARLLLRQKDNSTGSYPTILRMGDKDRTGSYNISFDDTNTINFGRRIEDNFEINNLNRQEDNLQYSKLINKKLWTHTDGMELRSETFIVSGGQSSKDGALVFAGAGDASGRWIQTKDKIKNPVIYLDIILGPYNTTRSVLGEGLGLSAPDTSAGQGLKIQVSKTGSSWTTIKSFLNDTTSLFESSSSQSLSAFESLLNDRKRIKTKLTPVDFSSMGSDSFYLRIIQETVTDANLANWGIGNIRIDYHDENVNFPLQIDAASRVGQKIATGAIATPHTLPTLTGTGRSVSGISDVHLEFTPGEDISFFEDSRIVVDSNQDFFRQGSDPDVIPGFSSPVLSKTYFEIDLSPSEEVTFGFITNATTASAVNETNDTIKQPLMVYWNKDLKRWEKIAQGISGNAMGNSLENMIASGALGFSGIDIVATGSSESIADQTLLSSNVLNSYVRPTSVFGFPFEGKYHATSSQYIKARDLGITKPFILEKCQLVFDSKFEFGPGSGASEINFSLLCGSGSGSTPSARFEANRQRVYIPTFFLLKQQELDFFTSEITYKVDVAGSFSENKRLVSIPGDYNLGTGADLTTINSSREMITYGQTTLFVSASVGSVSVDIGDVINNGLGRDLIIDVLKENGQGTFGASEAVDPLTGSYVMNFPSRITPKIEGGSRLTIKTTAGDAGGLWLNNRLGGRGNASTDTSARSVVRGTPSLTPAGTYKTFSTDNSSLPLDLEVASSENMDTYSPYIIMPDDNIILGWQYPATSLIRQRAPGLGDTLFHSMTPYGRSKLYLIGSQIKNDTEFHETINQNLSSNSVHEVIGSEAVLDQFDNARIGENQGNYLDSYIANLSEEPTSRVGSFVQSRITTPKSAGGAATGNITIYYNYVSVGSKKGGFNDGDRVAISDGTKKIHFYGFRNEPHFPYADDNDADSQYNDRPVSRRLGTGSPPNTLTNETISTSVGWGSDKYINLFSDTKNYGSSNGKTLGVSWGVSTSVITFPSSSGTNRYDNIATADGAESGEYYSFKLSGGDGLGGAYSGFESFNTLKNLKDAIEASSLNITPSLESGNESIFGDFWRLNLQQDVAGTSGNTVITITTATSSFGSLDPSSAGVTMQDQYILFSSDFSGGVDIGIDSSLGSFVRTISTQDALRVYSDSLLASSSIDSPFGAAKDFTGYGTFQTDGKEIRPKYYLNTKKFGQFIDLFEQAKDGKSKRQIRKTSPGSLDTIKGDALDSPINIVFVSGSNSNNTKIRSFRKTDNPTDVYNTSINSVLTGAFYEVG